MVIMLLLEVHSFEYGRHLGAATSAEPRYVGPIEDPGDRGLDGDLSGWYGMIVGSIK